MADTGPDPDAELARLERLLARSRGTFSLSFAVVRRRDVRRALIERLRADHPEIRVVTLDAGTDPLRAIESVVEGGSPTAVLVDGLDQALESTGSALLTRLNASRERWAHELPMPVILWMSPWVEQRLLERARDFTSWRSHTFRLEGLEPSRGTHEGGARRSPSRPALSFPIPDFFSPFDAWRPLVNRHAEERQRRSADLAASIAHEPGAARHGARVVELALLSALAGRTVAASRQLDAAEAVSDDPVHVGMIGTVRAFLARCREDRASEWLELQRCLFSRASSLDEIDQYHLRANSVVLASMVGRPARVALSMTRGALERLSHRWASPVPLALAEAVVACARGDAWPGERMPPFHAAIEEIERHPNLDAVDALSHAVSGLAFWMVGHLGEARIRFETCLDEMEILGNYRDVALSHLCLGAVTILHRDGDADPAEQHLREARRRFARLGAHERVAETDRWLATLADR